MMARLDSDLTLDELRAVLAPLLPRQAAFDGWRAAAVEGAARQAGVDPAIAQLVFADGATGMIDAWFASIDQRMAEAVPADALAAMKISARIAALVEARLTLLAPDREALRRALAILAMPQNLALSARLGWRAADRIWRLAGDNAVDYNHYTKRMTLGSVYGATILTFLDDDSEGHADTLAFLSRRLDGIMRFEKAKARFTAGSQNGFSLSRFVGRLRYPAR
ncbi:COQ9 family protein [soil metagenome]